MPKLKGSESLLKDWRLPCIIFPLPYGAFAKDPSLLGDFVRSPNPAESRKFYLISTLQIYQALSEVVTLCKSSLFVNHQAK
jgi:hypothetical protein